MKKFISLLLAAVLVFSAVTVIAEDEVFIPDDDDGYQDDLPGDDALADINLVPYDYDDITVGNPTPLNGQFFTDLWGNDTSDTDVRHLVSGYNLIIWDGDISVFRFDRSVVSGVIVTDDADGNRNYMITLYNDLYYSDGTQISARDYAFSVLLQCSPLIAELDGHPAVFDYLAGYEEYISDETPYFSGLRILADNIITFTVKKEALPYFYELSRLAFYPCPIHVIAPSYRVYDDGNGAYIAGADPNAAAGPLTSALLRDTILGAGSGYLSHPDPVSGPYCIRSYDGTSAVFEINPYFKGSEAGKKPRIKRITYTVADNASMIADLGSGKFALLNKVTKASSISDGLRLCMENPQYTRSTYPRSGLTYLYFSPESVPVRDQAVRQAIAYCLNKPEFIRDYVGAFGLQVEGLYGIGQWMYAAVSGTLAYPGKLPEEPTEAETAAYEEGVAVWDKLSFDGLTVYALDTDKAAELLEKAGWTLNEQGTLFNPASDSVRCKQADGELIKLELTLGYQSAAGIETALTEYFVNNLGQAGIRLTLVPLDFAPVAKAHNLRDFSSYDLMYLGDNFNISFDPALFYRTGNAAETGSLYAAYAELFTLSEDMDRTEPHDILGYMGKWLAFQEKLTELVPIVPVYSNIYFDFYTRELDEYWIEEHVSWAKAIVPARMRSIKTEDSDTAKIETELSFAEGDGSLDLTNLVGRTVHGSDDYSNGALARFPEEVRRTVPPEYRTLYEFVAARLNSQVDEETETLELHYYFPTLYSVGESVYLLFGIPGKGNNAQWFATEGFGQEDGSIHTELNKEQWEKLLDITFALAVVSK